MAASTRELRGWYGECSRQGMLDFRKAAELCTAQELVLLDASRPEALRRATPAGLKNQIARARTLQRKFRDLAARQAREARGKAAPRKARPARGNARTVAKAQLFGEVLKRFEGRAARLEEAAAREAIAVAPRAPAKRARRATASAKGARGAATRRARAARNVEPSSNANRRRRSTASAGTRKADAIDRSHATRLRGHQGSRNRRGQAGRDARR